MVIFLLLASYCIYSQEYLNKGPTYYATKTSISPKIDGILDSVWNRSIEISGFYQYFPNYKAKPSFDTKVRIMYDEYNLYIFAFCQDQNPDSILKQIGFRDAVNINADYFTIMFDFYNKEQDYYAFCVYASGTQYDYSLSNNNENIIWSSATLISDSGWTVEIKIPFSSIYIPKSDVQEWRFQCIRYIRRYREETRLYPEPKELTNQITVWPTLILQGRIATYSNFFSMINVTTGIQKDSIPYSRLSFMNSISFDIKYKINESHIIELALLPDFSHIKSDDKYKNLSAFETVYSENRPFFLTPADLLKKGNIFYSRRIGRLPRFFYKVNQALDTNKILIENPSKVKILNAAKIYGRNYKGLAIAMLNAITENTYAIIKDTNINQTQKFLTEPFANYNIFIIDKAYKNGNNIYFVNTSFLRKKNYYSSNVSVLGFNFFTKNNLFKISAENKVSTFFFGDKNIENYPEKIGHSLNFSIGKAYGSLKYGYSFEYMNKHFNANDVGLTLYNNYLNNNIYINYDIYYPRKKFLYQNYSISYVNNYHLETIKITQSYLNFNFSTTTIKHTTYFLNVSTSVLNSYDYYEPRTNNYFFKVGYYFSTFTGLSTDYRKPYAIDLFINNFYNFTYKTYSYNLKISQLGRLSDKFSFRYTIDFNKTINNYGYTSTLFHENEQIPIFGKRKLNTIINSLTAQYLFKKHKGIKLITRYYYTKCNYQKLMILDKEGNLSSEYVDTSPNKYNFINNIFNIDLTYEWNFSPGSILLFVFKTELLKELQNTNGISFSQNIRYLLNSGKIHTFLIKIQYYLDYKLLLQKRIN